VAIRVTAQPASRIRRIGRARLLRFFIVGVASVATNTGALYVLHGRLGVALPVAAALSFAISFVINFGLNRIWTFEAEGAMFGHFWRYLSLVLVNLGLNAGLVTALTWAGLPYLVSQIVTTGALSMMNFLISRRWVFT
jgi:putative flippase GtrA